MLFPVISKTAGPTCVPVISKTAGPTRVVFSYKQDCRTYPCCSSDSYKQDCRNDRAVPSFRSRWHRAARKGPYTLHPFSPQSPEGCPRSSATVAIGSVQHRSFPTSVVKRRLLPLSAFLSFRRSVSWCSASVKKFLKPLRSYATLTSCDVCCACRSICALTTSDFGRAGQWIHSTSCSRRLHGCVPVRAAHPGLHFLHQVHRVCENVCTWDLYVTLEGQPLQCVSNCSASLVRL